MKYALLKMIFIAAVLIAQFPVSSAQATCAYNSAYQLVCASEHVERRKISGYTHVAQSSYDFRSTHDNSSVIPPSQALRSALQHSPGSKGLGVRLLNGQRLMYAVKLKTGSQVRRILVDARTGNIVGE